MSRGEAESAGTTNAENVRMLAPPLEAPFAGAKVSR